MSWFNGAMDQYAPNIDKLSYHSNKAVYTAHACISTPNNSLSLLKSVNDNFKSVYIII